MFSNKRQNYSTIFVIKHGSKLDEPCGIKNYKYIMYTPFQGIGWHIIAYKHIEIDSVTGAKFVITTYHVFVMENSENQESSVNLALMQRSLEIYSKAHPQIHFSHITSDNAGYVL